LATHERRQSHPGLLERSECRDPGLAVESENAPVTTIGTVAEPIGGTNDVDEYIATLDEQTAADSRALIRLMKHITGQEPQLWNVGTIGFDAYHYKYESGREGDAQAASFYPRNGRFTLYLMDGTVRYAELLARLGKHTTTRVCVYFKRLSDIELPVLEQIVRDSYEHIKSQDGQMHRASE
jgi:hypothetical protein